MPVTLRNDQCFATEDKTEVVYPAGSEVELLADAELPEDGGPVRPRDAKGGKYRTWSEAARWHSYNGGRKTRASKGEQVPELWLVRLGGRIRWIPRADLETDSDRRRAHGR